MNNESELLNIYDDKGNLIGEATYGECYGKGIIIRITNIWVVNSRNQILLQKNNKPAHKGYGTWNGSVTGKINAGEAPLIGAQRELREEIGLDVPKEKLQFLETIFFEPEVPGTNYKAFVDIWVVKTDKDINDFVLEESEVAEVKWYDLDVVRNWREKIDIKSDSFDRRLKPLLGWFDSKDL
jgi:isopentenyl-diphosphate delta-isomerase